MCYDAYKLMNLVYENLLKEVVICIGNRQVIACGLRGFGSEVRIKIIQLLSKTK